MALARIITRSHACSRELALDLLARGYAVEIVSPDRIPDNLADLELRVDADPGNQLIANVKAHSGERSASIDFVHHLKAPMADFIRKPPQSAVEERFKVKAEATTGAEVFVEAPKPVSKAAPIGALSPDRGSNVVERGNSVLSRDKLPSALATAPNHSAKGPSIIHAPSMAPLKIARLKQHRRSRSVASLWRAAITLATIVLLAVSLWFGMRHGGKASAKISRSGPARKIATESSKALAADSPRDPAHSSPAVSDLKSKSAGTANPASNNFRLSSVRVKKSSKSADSNYVARDTVVYFDKRVAEEAAARTRQAKRLSKQQTHSASHNGGAVAANAVTFDDNSPPETAKQGSSVKAASPPN
jgi:hypothetical protein